MLNILFYNILLPSFIVAMALAGVYFYLSSYRHKALPRALAAGFAGSNYALTRGMKQGVSDFFYDIDKSLTDYRQLDAVLNFYTSSIEEIQKRFGKINRLAFIEKDSGPVGAIAILGFLSNKLKISSIIVRPRRRLLVNSIKGNLDKNAKSNIVIISDAATSGGGIKTAIEKLECENVRILGAVVLVNRMKKSNMDELGIPLFYAFHITEKSDLEKMPIKPYIQKKMKIKNNDPQLSEAA